MKRPVFKVTKLWEIAKLGSKLNQIHKLNLSCKDTKNKDIPHKELRDSFNIIRVSNVIIKMKTKQIKLGVSSGKCQRGEFVYLLWNVPIQIFLHNFRGLKWIPLKKRMASNFKTTTLAHSRLSLLLNNNNMALSFVGKYEQVSTYVSSKIPLYQS